jgi:hypothetical protein
MNRRTRRAFVRAMLCAATVSIGVLPATAGAQVTSDLTDWNLTESTSTWGTQYHISSSGDGWAAYRWLDSPNKATVISGNGCSDLSLYGSDTIGVGDTGYHNLFQGGAYLCFVLRGRTTSGSGSMVNHDGRVRR